MILQTACGCLVEPVVIFQPRRGGLLSNQKTAYIPGQMVVQRLPGRARKQTTLVFVTEVFVGHMITILHNGRMVELVMIFLRHLHGHLFNRMEVSTHGQMVGQHRDGTILF